MSAADAPRFTLVVDKEDCKFSCAHFTIFEASTAELLHGHNYQVRVELAGSTLDDEGLLADLARLKTDLRRLCAELDSHTLVPERCRHLELRHEGDEIELRFRQRRYRIPASEVVLLPIANTSIELLARFLFERLAETLDAPHVDTMAVSVEETAGQLCVYRGPVAGPRNGRGSSSVGAS